MKEIEHYTIPIYFSGPKPKYNNLVANTARLYLCY